MGKGKNLVTSIFSCCLNVFYPIKEFFHYFIEIVISKCFYLDKARVLSSGKMYTNKTIKRRESYGKKVQELEESEFVVMVNGRGLVLTLYVVYKEYPPLHQFISTRRLTNQSTKNQ